MVFSKILAGVQEVFEVKDQEILENSLDDLMAVTGAKEIKEGKFNVEFL